ncbi:MAG: hypothetical protein R2752_14790 [Vicinamibacterales bacterium]
MRNLVKLSLAMAVAIATVMSWQQATVYTQAGQISSPRTVPGIDKPVRVVRGRFTQNVTFTRDTYWVIRGAVFFGEPSRLTIESGTKVIGETATRGTLVIERGAQIIAIGTAAQPIVMTSDQPVGFRNRGDWGGLILNGRARVNLPGGVGIGEGSTGQYGGTNDDDSSGILQYVRVEFAGIEFSPDNELNGIAFQAVGRGTVVDHIQVHMNKDDGMEFFGGAVDAKHVILTNSGDDNFDWTFGWRGRLQFGIVLQRGDDADNGIEADNNGNNNDLLPRSAPQVYNVTFVGDRTSAYGPEGTDGMRLREGTAGIIRNFILMGWRSDAIDVRNTSTQEQITLGTLQTTHGIIFGNNSPWNSLAAPLIANAGGTVTQVDPMLVAPFNLTAPDFRPMPGSPALTQAPAIPPADGFFDVALFLGAMGPNVTDDWTRGWTYFVQK